MKPILPSEVFLYSHLKVDFELAGHKVKMGFIFQTS